MPTAHSYSRANFTDNLLSNRYQKNDLNNPQSRTQVAHYCHATKREHRRATNVRGLERLWLYLSMAGDGIISSMVGWLSDKRISISGGLLERPSGGVGFSQKNVQHKEKVRRGV